MLFSNFFLVAFLSFTGLVQCFQPPASLSRHRNLAMIHISGGEQQAAASQPYEISPLTATAADTSPATEPWTKPRLHNNPLVRSAAILGALALAGISTPFSKIPSTTAATVHLLSFATWFGTVFYTTFIAGLTMFKALPRQTFGKLQSKLFPKYFGLCSVSIVLQLITLGRLPRIGGVASKALLVSLAMTLLNQFLLEPKSTKIMFERYDMENSEDSSVQETEEYKVLKSSFGKLHGMSSLSNLIAMCGAAVHGACLASALVAV